MAKGSGTTRNSKLTSVHDKLRGAKLVISDSMPDNTEAEYGDGVIRVKPEVLSAIERLQKGIGTDNDIIKLSVLFHEVNHADADINKGFIQVRGWDFSGNDMATKALEVMNEIRSRVMLPSFAKSLGIKLPGNYEDILNSNPLRGYNANIRRLDKVINALGVSKKIVYDGIANASSHGFDGLVKVLANKAGIRDKNARHIVENAFGNGLDYEIFRKVAVTERYGRGVKVNAAMAKEAMKAKYGTDYPNANKYFNIDIAIQIIKKGKKNGTL